MKKTFIIFSVLLLLAACTSEDYDTRTYHAVAAEGYAYYNNKPLPDAKITVHNTFKSDGSYVHTFPVTESFTSDSAGYFRVRFIKRTKREDVIEYSIGFNIDSLYYNPDDDTLSFDYNDNTSIHISADAIRNAKQNIQLGVLNLKQNKYYYYYRN